MAYMSVPNPAAADTKVLNLHSASIWDWLYTVCIDTGMLWLTNIDIGFTPLCFTLSLEVKSHLQGQCHFIKHAVHPQAIAVSAEYNISDWAEWRAPGCLTHTITHKAHELHLELRSSCESILMLFAMSCCLLSVLDHLAFYQYLADWNALYQEWQFWEIWQNLCHGSHPPTSLLTKIHRLCLYRMLAIF